MKLALIEFLKKALKGGWKFIDKIADILTVYNYFHIKYHLYYTIFTCIFYCLFLYF